MLLEGALECCRRVALLRLSWHGYKHCIGTHLWHTNKIRSQAHAAALQREVQVILLLRCSDTGIVTALTLSLFVVRGRLATHVAHPNPDLRQLMCNT